VATTNFSDGTLITSEWCNEVDALVHDVFGGATSDAAARTALGVAIGSDVQAYDTDLTTLAAGGANARAFLGLTIGSDVQAAMSAASQNEMELGTEVALRSMSPLRVAQAITALSGPPAGTIIDFAGTSAPTGYLLCNGASLLRADYSDLFSAIGTTWGAVDGTHFTLPNFSTGWASVSGTPGSSTTGEVIAHTHTANSSSTTACAFTGSADKNPANGGTNTTSSTGGTHNLAGGNYVLKCIKT
jgi:microcystin-dependent protein